jgi:hypothetical protein
MRRFIFKAFCKIDNLLTLWQVIQIVEGLKDRPFSYT